MVTGDSAPLTNYLASFFFIILLTIEPPTSLSIFLLPVSQLDSELPQGWGLALVLFTAEHTGLRTELGIQKAVNKQICLQ